MKVPDLDPAVRDQLLSLPSVSRETVERLRCYVDLLVRWQKTINLVSKTTLPKVWRRHVLDAAQLALLRKDCGGRHVDLGSGAGFPGLVLAILCGGETHLVESDQRKAVFLREAARRTDSRVIVHAKRIEEMEPFTASLVTARALAPLPKLLSYCQRFMKSDGRALLPKGRTVRSELTELSEDWMMRVRLVGSAIDPESVIAVIEGVPDDRRDDAPSGRAEHT